MWMSIGYGEREGKFREKEMAGDTKMTKTMEKYRYDECRLEQKGESREIEAERL